MCEAMKERNKEGKRKAAKIKQKTKVNLSGKILYDGKGKHTKMQSVESQNALEGVSN